MRAWIWSGRDGQSAFPAEAIQSSGNTKTGAHINTEAEYHALSAQTMMFGLADQPNSTISKMLILS